VATALARLVPGSTTWLLEDDGAGARVLVRGGRPASAAFEEEVLAAVAALPRTQTVDAAPLATGAVIVARVAIVGRADMLLLATVDGVGRETMRSVETLAQQLRGTIESLLLAEELHRRQQERRFKALVEHSAELVTVVDNDGLVSFASPAARTLLGHHELELIGKPPFAGIHPDDAATADALLARARYARDVVDPVEMRFRDGAGDWRWFEVRVDNLLDHPEVGGVVVHTRDVTDRKSLEDELRHLAMHDPLTGLANRNLFKQALDQALTGVKPVAILYLDIDDFKSVNDSLGHSSGDQVLREVARRMATTLRDGDVPARIGGDEFAVLLGGVTDRSVPLDIGDRLLAKLREPIEVAHSRVQLTVSLGAAISEPTSTSETLMRDADVAMYLSKSGGKDGRTLFEQSMLTSFNERLELKRDLAHAVERNELFLLYQPVYDLTTGRMTHVEALLRWRHSERGLIGPDQFIPLAEESGEIVPIGGWVLDQATQQLAQWRAEGADPMIAVSVNLSVVQLEAPETVGRICDSIRRAGLEPSALLLEVTESVFAANVDLVGRRLDELHRHGIKLALDDFGTGFSSLSYLQHFHLDMLKIDRTFLNANDDPRQQEAILRAIIDLASSRGMVTVAEGVEEETQVMLLRHVGCAAVQGYLFARPLPPDEVLRAADRATSLLRSHVQPV
jgi:diguanylate cyclase (GGDEF)-like protein/PAS domain S-box-containing protein